MLDFRVEVTLDGESLTEEEIAKLLAGGSGLRYVRGRWVEVDRDKLARLLEQFRAAEKTVEDSGVSFGYAMRLMSGAETPGDRITDEPTLEWSRISAGDWFAKTLHDIRNPANLARFTTGDQLHATLRPYQETGVRWLHLLSTLGLGACLADDMGLGKTIQVIALMLVLRNTGYLRGPSLVVAPASLLANWTAELQRFAPDRKSVV